MKFSKNLNKLITATAVLTVLWLGVAFFNRQMATVAPIVIKTAPVKTSGEVICLPHKDTRGPVTLECAFGIKTTDGNYALSDPGMKYVGSLPTGKRVTVEGILREEKNSKYAILGVIEITSISK